MTAKIHPLAHGYGITPALQKVQEDFWNELCDCMEKATAAGLPLGLLIGTIEVAKTSTINLSTGDL